MVLMVQRLANFKVDVWSDHIQRSMITKTGWTADLKAQ